MDSESLQVKINGQVIKLLTNQTQQIKVLTESLIELNKRIKALEPNKPKSFL